MAHTAPSQVELQVLAILWQQGPSSVHDVRAALKSGNSRAYTTVLTVMQNMEKKGLVDHTQQGQANIYRAVVKRQEVLRPLMKSLVSNVFGGSRAQALQFLLHGADVDDAELDEIHEILAAAKRKKPKEDEQ